MLSDMGGNIREAWNRSCGATPVRTPTSRMPKTKRRTNNRTWVLFAREGADVAIVYLPEEQEDAEVTESAVVAEGRRCLLIPGDVRDSSFCEMAVEATVKMFGSLDVLVNNAAFQQHQESIEDLTDEQLERTFRTNIFGYIYMARAAVKQMPRGSTIINTGSITGLEGSGQLLDYSATKGAIHAFTKSLAQNLVQRGFA